MCPPLTRCLIAPSHRSVSAAPYSPPPQCKREAIATGIIPTFSPRCRCMPTLVACGDSLDRVSSCSARTTMRKGSDVQTRPTDMCQMRTLASRRSACGDACLFQEHREVSLICRHCGNQASAQRLTTLVDVTVHGVRTIRFARSDAPTVRNYHHGLAASPRRRT